MSEYQTASIFNITVRPNSKVKHGILSTLSRSTQHAKVIAPKNGIKVPTEYVNGPDLFSFVVLILNIAIAEGPKVTKDAQSNAIPVVTRVWKISKSSISIPDITPKVIANCPEMLSPT